jgi:membrane protease YdiL (CAAX protease family)
MVVIPIYLIKKHKLSWNTLGLRKAKYSEIFLGIFVALIYVALVRISPFWKSLNFNKLDIENNYFYLVFLFISVSGFPKVILSPICEEIFYRGLIFGVFREKFPKPISLIFQSLVFSLAHISWVHFRIVDSLLIFVCGMIFGVLYESTKSLYPAMVCHGLINYFSLILSFVNI